ncbi:MAG: hypothetical protein A3C90_04790 [Candidatus Magasanikbacteria bacterium RIFCSPHIGHO2_02_FULL_51_14]|uniref:AB hydrolase-1 domain-containing protein n=1 Tax=Candidatus Magasanikbacteria bacterium RIFCSPHIGHO2_02_FULL_51_14 TaxID=1798683 RepID=A0A1F6MDH0_9BACT|nr:MAG: hypothetical protein A3C90_04790 [Candidatus Magasanikbacteria bacterium RIFCSPHIGHO2_02_FULL_51_14]
MTDQTLVIIPGWGGSHETWREFEALAKPHFADVRVIDLPCFGGIPCPSGVWGIEEYAQFVQSEIKNLKSKIILLGHSFGGAVATYLIANSPDIASKLILVGAAIIRPRNLAKRFVVGLAAKLGKSAFRLPGLNRLESFAKKLLYRSLDSPETATETGIQKEIHTKIVRQDLTHLLNKIQVPTLVVWGTRDKQTPLQYGRRIADLIPNAKLAILDGGRHGLHHTHQEELLDAIGKFTL